MIFIRLITMNQLYFKNIYRIPSIRLSRRDYWDIWYYFITLCTKYRINYFGKINEGQMILNEYGKTIHTLRKNIPDHFPNTKLDQFIIMPNHIHWIIHIYKKNWKNIFRTDVAILHLNEDHLSNENLNENNSLNPNNRNSEDYLQYLNHINIPSPKSISGYYSNISPKSQSIGTIIRSFKSIATKTLNQIRPWYFRRQANYYERILMDEDQLNIVRQYIINNPQKRRIKKRWSWI